MRLADGQVDADEHARRKQPHPFGAWIGDPWDWRILARVEMLPVDGLTTGLMKLKVA